MALLGRKRNHLPWPRLLQDVSWLICRNPSAHLGWMLTYEIHLQSTNLFWGRYAHWQYENLRIKTRFLNRPLLTLACLKIWLLKDHLLALSLDDSESLIALYGPRASFHRVISLLTKSIPRLGVFWIECTSQSDVNLPKRTFYLLSHGFASLVSQHRVSLYRHQV